MDIAPLVFSLHDGHAGMADLLGGEGANLGEMTRLGLPVPEGFVVSTAACREYLADGHPPVRRHAEITTKVARLDQLTRLRLGNATSPLLVSVRSGARLSMPGMMKTVLNVGLVDDAVEGLVRRGGERFAWECSAGWSRCTGTPFSAWTMPCSSRGSRGPPRERSTGRQ